MPLIHLHLRKVFTSRQLMGNMALCLTCLILLMACQDRTIETPKAQAARDSVIAVPKETAYREDDRSYWQNPDLVIDRLGPIGDKVIADLGAGAGYFTFRLLPYAKRVIAIDVDRRMTDFIETNALSLDSMLRSKVDVRLADLDDPHIQAGEVDIVFLSNTYTFLQDRTAYFTRLRPLLKSGARVVVVDFKKKQIPVHEDQASRLALYQVENELIAAGYAIRLSDDQSLPYQYILIAEVR